MIDNPEKPSRFVGPHTYITAAKSLIYREDNILLSFDELTRGVTRFLLTGRSSRSLIQAKLETRRALQDHGLWAYTTVYWQSDSFFVKDDFFGLGEGRDKINSESGVRTPIIPQISNKIFRYNPKMFGLFEPEEFEKSPAIDLFAENSDKIVALARKNLTRILVKGRKVQDGELVRTVCSMGIKRGNLVFDLAEDENALHYAIGRKAKNYDPSRFNQP